MLEGSDSYNAYVWNKRAKNLAFRLNLCWWLHYFIPLLLLQSLVVFLVVTISRLTGFYSFGIWGLNFIGIILSIILSFYFSRKKYFSSSDTILELDLHNGLKGRLTSAASGICEWPDSSMLYKTPYPPRILETTTIAICGFILPLFSFVITINSLNDIEAEGIAIEPPVVFSQLSKSIESLENNELIDGDSIGKYKKEIKKLYNEPRKNWYKHSSLEAGASLLDNMKKESSELKDVLTSIDSDLSSMEQINKNTPEYVKDEHNRKMSKNMNRLASSSIGLEKKLNDKLSTAISNGFENLTESEKAKISSSIKKALNKLNNKKTEINKNNKEAKVKPQFADKTLAESSLKHNKSNNLNTKKSYMPNRQKNNNLGFDDQSDSKANSSGQDYQDKQHVIASSTKKGTNSNLQFKEVKNKGKNYRLNNDEFFPIDAFKSNKSSIPVDISESKFKSALKAPPNFRAKLEDTDSGGDFDKSSGNSSVWSQSYSQREIEVLKNYYNKK